MGSRPMDRMHMGLLFGFLKSVWAFVFCESLGPDTPRTLEFRAYRG